MSEHCSGDCEHCQSKEKEQEACQIAKCLAKIGRKLVVMSGKGGVGKSTVAVNLAFQLARCGKKVGLLDVDFHGPSIPVMLNLEGVQLESEDEKLLPVDVQGLKVMSIGLLLQSDDAPIIWRGPMKIGVITQMFTNVEWGDLDYLVVDCPPGTGDEPLSVCQTFAGQGGEAAVIVTTPQQVSASDVSKSINFCRQLNFPIAGIIENMSGFVCPHCGQVTQIFAQGAGERLAKGYGIPFLGSLPIDPSICQGGDMGDPFVRLDENPAAEQFRDITDRLMD